MADLTNVQKRALAWIDGFACHEAEWRAGSKPATGKPETWDRMRLSGPEGSIVVMLDDWIAINQLLEPAPFGTKNKIYVVSSAGRALLQQQDSKP